jgi:hypothetical protein
MRRWFVVDIRVWEVQAPTEAEAIAIVEDSPDRAPIHHTTEAELAAPPAPAAEHRPALRVL